MKFTKKIKNKIYTFLNYHELKSFENDLIYFKEHTLTESYSCDFNEKTKRERKSTFSIAFIVPKLGFGFGGQLSLLRLGDFWRKQGNEVYYISYENQPVEAMEVAAKRNFPFFKGKFCAMSYFENNTIDIVIATDWRSAYFVKDIVNTSYKIYFVQDYEPYFYPRGDKYFFSKATYDFGFEMVSLGDWNKAIIKKEHNRSINSVTFPYEPLEYSRQDTKIIKNKYQNIETIKICAYIKADEKRGALLVLLSLEKLYFELRAAGKKLEVYFIGDNCSFSYPISFSYRFLGRVSIAELNKLYQECHFGVVFSYTNISLVTFAMMASGCPVIEVLDGSFPVFFNENAGILINSDPEDLSRKLLYKINNPELIIKQIELAYQLVQNNDWETTAQEFMDIIKKNYNKR